MCIRDSVQSNQKIIEEEPALCLTPQRREELLATAMRLAQLFKVENLATVEFLVDDAGQFYFSEIKSRIQIAHTLAEIVSRIDLVREQIRLEAGEPLAYRQGGRRRPGPGRHVPAPGEGPANRQLPPPRRAR